MQIFCINDFVLGKHNADPHRSVPVEPVVGRSYPAGKSDDASVWCIGLLARLIISQFSKFCYLTMMVIFPPAPSIGFSCLTKALP